MDTVKEELSYENYGDATYTIQIRNFHHKMKNWAPGNSIRTKQFQLQGLDLSLEVYPNGRDDQVKGFVSVYLQNDTTNQIFVNYNLKIGDQDELEMEECHLEPKKLY